MNKYSKKNRTNNKGKSNLAFFKLHTVFFILSGILLIIGMSSAYAVYMEGNTAKNNAQQSLEEVEQMLLINDQGERSISSEPPNTYEEYSTNDSGEIPSQFRRLPLESIDTEPIDSEPIDSEPMDSEPIENESGESGPIERSKPGYTPIAKIEAETIDLSISVLSSWSYELLEISVNKFHGPEPNEQGNFIVVGHRYKNGTHFGRLHLLEIGDLIELTDLSGRTIQYEVYEMFIIKPDDVEKLQSNHSLALTLITCDDDNEYRLVVKSKAIHQ